MAEVTIVDYGMGNLCSVMRAFEHFGVSTVLAETTEGIQSAKRLILPGVGSFADGIQNLRRHGLAAAIQAYAGSGRPFLGICLGMQLMLDTSEEFGLHTGLGLISGTVKALPATDNDQPARKVPHVAWSPLHRSAGCESWDNTILQGIPDGATTYFVHSYYAAPADPAHCIAHCNHDGFLFPAVLNSGRLYGCQFHPEKSGDIGLKIIYNFMQQ